MKQIIYVVSPEKKTIEVWNFSSNTNVQLIQIIRTDGQVQPIEIIYNNNLFYAGVRPNNQIIMYKIKKNGFLEQINQSIIPGSPNYISFDCKKKFLFCSSYNANCLSVSPLNAYGIVQNPIQIIHNIQGCHAAKMVCKHNLLLVTALKEDRIYLYNIHDSGMLEKTEQKFICTKTHAGPRHIAIHPNQDIFYTINELNGTIDVWKIYLEKQKTIKIKNIQTINFSSSKFLSTSSNIFWASDIHVTSCGRFLYSADRASNTIGLFHINLNNSTLVFVKNYLTEQQPRSFCIDSYNKYLIVTGQKSHTFTIYSISSITGDLKKINTYNTGRGALWVLTSPLFI